MQASTIETSIPEGALENDQEAALATDRLHDGSEFDELILQTLCGQTSEPRDPEDLRELLNSFPGLLSLQNSKLRSKCLGADTAQVEMLVKGMAGLAMDHLASS